MPAETDSRPQIVYIQSAGHSGSTLLSLLLNAHSRLHALSEISKLGDYARAPERGRRPLESELWRAARAHYERERGRPLSQIDLSHPKAGRFGDALREWADDYAAMARAVSAASGKPLLVDSSKNEGPLLSMLRANRFRVRVLSLSRDGRAVLHSHLRKGETFATSFGAWSGSRRAADRLRALVTPEDWLDLRYEDLARGPEAELRRICAFLGVAFEPRMLAFNEARWDGVSGNRMARRNEGTIVLDERWRRELALHHRALFALLAGMQNLRRPGSRVSSAPTPP